MGVLTSFFDLIKPAKTDPAAIGVINDDLDIIDEELHKPPLTVNDTAPDASRNIQIETVPLADNLTSDTAQLNTGTFRIRTSGGAASISDGAAWLTDVRGHMEKTGYVAEVLECTCSNDALTVAIDRETFLVAVAASTVITLNYSGGWSEDPANYGVTVTGSPASGDQIVITYTQENRGTITPAAPTSFISTGWNLFDFSKGYARVTDYSDEYGYMIDGTYTGLQFAETLTGQRTTITPVNGFFVVPGTGYLFVIGGNDTDTAVWAAWGDWTDEANGGVWEAYTESVIDLSGIMVNFPNGLMRVENYYDEINLNTSRAISRIDRMEYSDENLALIVSLGVPYETDTNWIYYPRTEPATYVVSLSGEYTVDDHGTELFTGSAVPVTASILYGQDLKGKLLRDTVTISAQELTEAQKAQVRENIGAAEDVFAMKSGTNGTTSIASAQYTNIASLVLQKGTWLIIGHAGFTASFTEMVILRILRGSTQQTASIVRGTGDGGGGLISMLLITETADSANYYLSVYQNSGSAKTVDQVSLKAIRLM